MDSALPAVMMLYWSVGLGWALLRINSEAGRKAAAHIRVAASSWPGDLVLLFSTIAIMVFSIVWPAFVVTTLVRQGRKK